MRKITWLLIPAFVVLALLPTLLSIPPLKALFVKALERRVEAKLQISHIRLSWLGPQQFSQIQFQATGVEGTIEQFTAPVPFWLLSSMKRSFLLKNGTCQVLDPPATVEEIQAKVHLPAIQVSAITREANQTGRISIQGTLSDCTVDANAVPSLFADRVLRAQGLIPALLGPSFDLQAKLQSKQELDLSISSSRGRIDLSATIAPHSITLRKPFSAALLIYHPPIQSTQPIRLQIAPEEFSCAIPFSWEKLRIGQGLLDLGRLRLYNAPLGSISQLLKKSPFSQETDVWLSPVDFQYKNGTLSFGRIDALLNGSTHLFAWGTIELPSTRLRADLGIPSDTIAKAFGLRNLPSSFAVKVPVRGTLKNPEFSTGPATAKIAAITAVQQIPKAGGILGLFGAAAADDTEDFPPPRRPFPWE